MNFDPEHPDFKSTRGREWLRRQREMEEAERLEMVRMWEAQQEAILNNDGYVNLVLNELDPSTPLDASQNDGYQTLKKGGIVKKTGLAYVHKGERVLSLKQKKKYEEDKKELSKLKMQLKTKCQSKPKPKSKHKPKPKPKPKLKPNQKPKGKRK